jgi:DNA polymerase beta
MEMTSGKGGLRGCKVCRVARVSFVGWRYCESAIRFLFVYINSLNRRDISYASHRSAGAASIALTGDSAFNLSIRAAASRLGYSLNEYGLWRWRGVTEADPPGEFSDEESVRQYGGYWDLVEGVSAKEEDIFEAVRMEWVAPDRRNFQFLDEKVASPKKRGRK